MQGAGRRSRANASPDLPLSESLDTYFQADIEDLLIESRRGYENA